MTCGNRIALQLLSAPLLGALTTVLPLMAGAAIIEGREISNPVETLVLVIFYAYFVAALPTLAFALIMEFCFAHGLKPGSWKAISLSSVLGGLAGGLLGMGFFPSNFYVGIVFVVGGAVTGLIIGILIRLFDSNRPISGLGAGGRTL